MATLTSELDVATIATHYQDQLAAAGWTLEAGEQQGAVAWSRWTFADKNGDAWRGMFVLLQTSAAPSQYSVAGPRAGGGCRRFTSWFNWHH
jgi:hypothetical protein